MKCVCGYTHYKEYEIEDMLDKDQEYIQGDKEFLRAKNSMFFDSLDSYYSCTIERVVYACPKCGTLKIEN